MKKVVLLICVVLGLVACRTRYNQIDIDKDGKPIYRTICKRDPTDCKVFAMDACENGYNEIEWLNRRYIANAFTPVQAAVQMTNTIVTKDPAKGNTAQTDVLIFSCK